MSDLRESGAIEQDADMVCFIHRPEYYHFYTDEKGTDLRGLAEIIIAKHRSGATDSVYLRFRSKYAKFQNQGDAVDDDENEMPAPPIPSDGGYQSFQSKMNNMSPDGASMNGGFPLDQNNSMGDSGESAF